MDKDEFDSVKIGEKVGFVFGPGEFPEDNLGVVTAKVEDRWGFHIDVVMDGGNQVSVEGFTKNGVGCYYRGRKRIIQIIKEVERDHGTEMLISEIKKHAEEYYTSEAVDERILIMKRDGILFSSDKDTVRFVR